MKTIMKTKQRPRVLQDYVLVFKVPTSLVDRIDQHAREEGMTRTAVIRRLLIRTYGLPFNESAGL